MERITDDEGVSARGHGRRGRTAVAFGSGGVATAAASQAPVEIVVAGVVVGPAAKVGVELAEGAAGRRRADHRGAVQVDVVDRRVAGAAAARPRRRPGAALLGHHLQRHLVAASVTATNDDVTIKSLVRLVTNREPYR